MTEARIFPYKKYIHFLGEIFFFVLIIGVLHYRSALFLEPSKLYSPSLAHRLQTDALLRGHLRLSPRPFGLPWDCIWSERGMQQNWGMGVVLLRLPFEWASKQCGFGPFPDRLILFFYLALMIVLFNVSLRSVLGALGLSAYGVMSLLIRWYVVAWILFCPTTGILLERTASVYDETVFYSCVYSYILLFLLWIYIRRPHNRLFFVLCLASGFACLVRPTLIFYGLVTATLAVIHAYQYTRNRRLALMGIFCFCLGMLVDLGFNYLRFGSIFEFGYSGSLDNASSLMYALRFGYPFSREPFLSAAKELIGALFLDHSWQSQTFRYREYDFTAYNVSHAMIMGVGSIIFVFLLSRWRLFYQKMGDSCFRIIYSSLFLGLMSFIFMFMFYLHAPGLASRYLSDFSTAINSVLIALILFGIFYLTSRGWGRRKTLVLFIMATMPFFYVNNKAFFNFDYKLDRRNYTEHFVDKKMVMELVDSFHQINLVNPSLPEIFYCGHNYSIPGLNFQFTGWNISKDCLVSASTSVFLPAKKCLTLNYSITNLGQWPPIRVKRDFVFLKLTGSKVIEDNRPPFKYQMTQRFCSDAFPTNTVALYSIGWVKVDELNDKELPLALNWVGVPDK